MPGIVRSGATSALSLYGDSKFGSIIAAAREKTVTELLVWQKARQDFAKALHKRVRQRSRG